MAKHRTSNLAIWSHWAQAGLLRPFVCIIETCKNCLWGAIPKPRLLLLLRQHLENSVTRFGEISPFWQTFQIIWKHFEGLFSIWHYFESTWANFVSFWANFYCRELPYNEKIYLLSGHTSLEVLDARNSCATNLRLFGPLKRTSLISQFSPKYRTYQCDQIGQFIALWASFKAFGNN